ncbi:YppE family protein [bacterium LRH843]|nr:YppE family protein [bacterium LRH843]
MDHQFRSELIKWTNELIRLNNEAKQFYTQVARAEGYEPDFFGMVKPFADEVKEVRDKWLPLAMTFVRQTKPLHLHPIQITQTEDNLETVAIKSFYGKTSLKIQMETFKSVDYVLKQVLQNVAEQGLEN